MHKNWVFNTVKSIQFGAGALKQLGVLSKSSKRILVVTDPGILANTSFIDEVKSLCIAAGVEMGVFSKVMADPTEAIVLEATAAAVDYKATAIVGLGGGSSLDVAKLVSVLAMGTQKLSDIYGVGNVKGSRIPLTLIPTTAGTGSEATMVSIVTTGVTTKMGVVSPILLPDVAIMDPELTYNLPPHITAATGIDAMVHAIEAFTSASPNNNPISRHLAVESLRIMTPAIERAVHSGKTDHSARHDMMYGSMLAGQAFANSPVAAVHALAYPIGGQFKVSHGLSNTLVLPHVIRFNAETNPEPYAMLYNLMFAQARSNSASNSNPDVMRNALAFADELANLSQRCGLEHRLRDVNIPQNAVPLLASDAMKQTRLLVNNPRELTLQDATNIYNSAW